MGSEMCIRDRTFIQDMTKGEQRRSDVVLREVGEELARSRDKLTRLRLHQILKRKVERQKR